MIRRELILPVVVSFAVGVVVSLALKAAVTDSSAARDIIDSYLRGQRDALSIKNPSAELEVSCAGLWLSQHPQK